MKLPDEQKEDIIAGLLQFLDPEQMENFDTVKNIEGRDLINLHGIYKTQDGAQILPGVIYSVSFTERRKVNHVQRIGQTIADADNVEDMFEKLGAYLAKYAKDRSEVLATIPTNSLLLNKIKTGRNVN